MSQESCQAIAPLRGKRCMHALRGLVDATSVSLRVSQSDASAIERLATRTVAGASDTESRVLQGPHGLVPLHARRRAWERWVTTAHLLLPHRQARLSPTE